MLIKANKSSFEAHTNAGLVLVDFYADWCGPCKMIAPILEEMGKEYDHFNIVKVNVDEEQELAMTYGIMSIPTLVIMKNGHLVSREAGFKTKDQLLNWLNQYK
jgi:thioredoxin 1